MTQGSNIRIESLFFSLKELQNEKICLEQKLHEVKLKRHSLEQELDHETLAVAQQKVDQTMSTSLRLQADVEQIRPKVEELRGIIETEKNLQLQYITEFEASLLSISSQLFSARDFYKSSNLHTEINNTQKACLQIDQQVERESRDVQNLTRCLEKLSHDEKSSSLSTFGIETSLYTCFKIMEQDEKEAEEYLNHIQAELKEIHDILRSVD